jgi:hypothetical protein
LEGAGKSKAPAGKSGSKARRAAAAPALPKGQVAGVGKAGSDGTIFVRAEPARARRVPPVAPVTVIPETPPPLPAPIASFTF